MVSAIVSVLCLKPERRTVPEESERMLIRTIHGALARGGQVGAPAMSFGRMTLGWQQRPSFVARLLATPILWAGPDAGAVPAEWTGS